MRVTLEQKKRGLSSKSRKDEVYSLDDLRNIKDRIDERYKEDQELKLRLFLEFFDWEGFLEFQPLELTR